MTAQEPRTVHEHAHVQEFPGSAHSGIKVLGVLVLCLLASLFILIAGAANGAPLLVVLGIVGLVLTPAMFLGFFLLQPNQSMVLILFGKYKGSFKEDGWYWANPFTVFERKKVSLRVHNFQTDPSKVNDAEGNPIEIAAVVVYRVVDTAKSIFEVEDYEDYVFIQSETAIRHLGTQYPYDDFSGERTSLRANPDEVALTLHSELQDRLDDAGVEVVETRLTHLAYATEIAEAMLRRQQAEAVVAARKTIVEGAVGMVEDAIEMLGERDVVELDNERKATMVSNLLVVLTSEQQTTPVVNAGSLY